MGVITEANTEGKCCVCWEGGYFCIKPKTCCQEQIQYCCIDYRCALPCTDEVPCLCTCCPFLVLYPKPGCCKTVGPHGEGRRGGAGAAGDVLSRSARHAERRRVGVRCAP